MKKYLPHICVLASGVLWGLIGIFNRRLTGAGLSVGSIVLIRNFGSMLVLGLLFLLKDPKIFRIKARHIPIFLGTGVVSVSLKKSAGNASRTRCKPSRICFATFSSPKNLN